MRRLISACLILAILLFVAGCSEDSNPPPPTRSSSRARSRDVGPAATPPSNGPVLFRLPALDGRTVTARGPVALFFFTSWCGYCKQVLPETNRLAGVARNRGWRVYGIDVNETPDKGQWFVQNYQPNFPVLIDQSGQVSSQFGVNGVPTFVLIDGSGRVIYNDHSIPNNF